MKTTPQAPWADALPSARDPKRFLPQNIGHRGYKARYPENTMIGFQAAIDAGAHAIETDVHLTADGVVVLSHDPTGKRCYGVDKKISDCTWESIQWWRTLSEPHQSMPRLEDILAWLAEPRNDEIWLVLDIKVDDPAIDLMGAIAKVLAKAPASRPWDERVVLGCWNATFTTVARKLLPTFPLVHISISVFYSAHFFRVPGMGMNMLQKSLIGPLGWWFIHKVRKSGRQLFVWTVNDERWMEWCIRKNTCRSFVTDRSKNESLGETSSGGKVIDGVITDDPGLFRQVCERWEDEQDGKVESAKIGAFSQAKRALSDALLAIGVQLVVILLLARFFYNGRLNLFRASVDLQ